MTSVQECLNSWILSLASSESAIIKCANQAASAIEEYHKKNITIDWTELNAGISIASYVIPYCRQYQLLEAAILLPMTLALSNEELSQCIDNQDVLTLLTVIRRMNIVNATYLNQQDTPSNNTQSKLRKMLLALVTDIRAVVIKLAEQRHLLETLPKKKTTHGEQLALLARDIYAPLANRLGLYHLKWPIEDLSFRQLDLDRYMTIAKGLRETRVEREAFIEYATHCLSECLKSELPQLPASIKGRAKHIYSIHKKSERKNIAPNALFDMTAIRVLVNTNEDCYHILACLHNKWEHVPEEYDDYISRPKGNGYQSIHTVALINKHLVEIQIRTHAMHQSAELGVAAHWKYKEANSSALSQTPSVNWLNELLHWQEEITTDKPNVFQHTFANRIYVFTPDHQVIDLDLGATAVDFAYAVHTQIGHRCKSAKIGDRIIPLNHPLQTGDIVTIITQKEPKPRQDWLNSERGYIKTRSAISKIKSWFKKQRHDEYITSGRAIWDKHLRKENIKNEDTQTLLRHFNLSHIDDLMIALGSSDLKIRTILRQLRQITQTNNPDNKPSSSDVIKNTSPSSSKTGVIVDGIGCLSTQLARCCYPIPGDSIIGYLTRAHGISVHHTFCENRKQDSDRKRERQIDATWGDTSTHYYSAHIRIICENDQAITDSLWTVLSQHETKLIRSQSQVNRQQSRRFHHVLIQVNDKLQLNAVIQALTHVRGVFQISRIGVDHAL